MNNSQKVTSVSGINKLDLLLFLFVPIVSMILINIAIIIPYIGSIFQLLGSIIGFFVFFFIGMHGAEKAKGNKPAIRSFLFGYVFIVCTLTFAVPYIVGYYTYPIKVSRNFTKETHSSMTNMQASKAIKDMLITETGSDGIVAYAIYSERQQLSVSSYGKFVGNQFEDVDDLGGIVGAIINIILYSIPMLLKWIICDKLELIKEAGFVGLFFWYFFSLTLSYIGWKSES